MLKTSVAEPADQSYGDRLARITDLHNNQWSISTHIEDLALDEIALPPLYTAGNLIFSYPIV